MLALVSQGTRAPLENVEDDFDQRWHERFIKVPTRYIFSSSDLPFLKEWNLKQKFSFLYLFIIVPFKDIFDLYE